MLKFFRKHAAIVGLGIIIFFGSTMFAGAFFFGRSSTPDIPQQSSQDYNNQLGWLGDIPIDKYKYQSALSSFIQQLQSFQPNIYSNPESLERQQYRAFQYAINQSILINAAIEKKIRISRKDKKNKLEEIITNQNLENINDLKKQLKQNNYPYDLFERNIEKTILTEKVTDQIKSEVQVTIQDVENQYTELQIETITIENNDPEQSLLETLQSKINQDNTFKTLKETFSPDKETSTQWISTTQSNFNFDDTEYEQELYQLNINEIANPYEKNKTLYISKILDIKEIEKPAEFDIQAEQEKLLTKKQNEALQAFIENEKNEKELVIIDPYIKAYDLKSNQKYQEAINSYQQVISQSPSNPAPHYLIAKIYQNNLNNTPAALLEYQKAEIKGEIRKDLDSPKTHIEYAKLLTKENQPKKASKQYQLAIPLAQDDLFMLTSIEKELKSLNETDILIEVQTAISTLKEKQEEKQKQQEAALKAIEEESKQIQETQEKQTP